MRRELLGESGGAAKYAQSGHCFWCGNVIRQCYWIASKLSCYENKSIVFNRLNVLGVWPQAGPRKQGICALLSFESITFSKCRRRAAPGTTFLSPCNLLHKRRWSAYFAAVKEEKKAAMSSMSWSDSPATMPYICAALAPLRVPSLNALSCSTM